MHKKYTKINAGIGKRKTHKNPIELKNITINCPRPMLIRIVKMLIVRKTDRVIPPRMASK